MKTENLHPIPTRKIVVHSQEQKDDVEKTLGFKFHGDTVYIPADKKTPYFTTIPLNLKPSDY